MRRKRRAVEPYVPPLDAPPLADVVRDLIARQVQFSHLDDEIGRRLATVERAFRKLYTAGRPVDVPFPPWGKLAWSGRRGRWRLVVLEEDDCTDLFNMPALCRNDACHVLRKLAERMELL